MTRSELMPGGRHSIRLPGYDYSQAGAYFITLVTRERECLFGDIEDGRLCLYAAGRVVWEIWESLPARYPGVALGAAVVMPNHFHGIIEISGPGAIPVGAIHVGAIHKLPLRESRVERRRMTLPLVVGYFKMNSAKRINLLLGSSGIPVWQRNYYEPIIKDEAEHEHIHLYIEANVDNWSWDEEDPGKPG